MDKYIEDHADEMPDHVLALGAVDRCLCVGCVCVFVQRWNAVVSHPPALHLKRPLFPPFSHRGGLVESDSGAFAPTGFSFGGTPSQQTNFSVIFHTLLAPYALCPCVSCVYRVCRVCVYAPVCRANLRPPTAPGVTNASARFIHPPPPPQPVACSEGMTTLDASGDPAGSDVSAIGGAYGVATAELQTEDEKYFYYHHSQARKTVGRRVGW